MSFESLDDDGRAEAAHEWRITRCGGRGCNAKIIWLTQPGTGRKVPADEGTVEAGEYEFVWGRHRNHFDTCPDPGHYSRRRP